MSRLLEFLVELIQGFFDVEFKYHENGFFKCKLTGMPAGVRIVIGMRRWIRECPDGDDFRHIES